MFRFLVIFLSVLVVSACHSSNGGSDIDKHSPELPRDERNPNPDSNVCEVIVAFTDEAGRVCHYKKSSHKVEIRIYPALNGSSKIKDSFSQSEDRQKVKLVRKIHQIAEKYHLNKWGFYLNGNPDGLYFVLHSNVVSSDLRNASIRLDAQSSSDPAPEYKSYVEQGERYRGPDEQQRDVTESQQSVSFWSLSGRSRLIIPKKNYLTIFHFSRDAGDDEIIDLWTLIGSELQRAGNNAFKNLAVHTGSLHAQSVKHFHFRLEI